MVVTIITPSFQHGRFISFTLMSLLKQKGDFFLDLHVMDGGSNDNTLGILQTFENLVCQGQTIFELQDRKFWKNKNIQCNGISFSWVSKPDGGQVQALINGFAKACGDVYGWLNSDDILLNDLVISQAVSTLKYNVDVVTADGFFIDVDGKEIGPHRVDKVNLKELLYLDYHILQPATFFKRHVYETVHLDTRFTCVFDAYFFIKSIKLGHSWVKLNVDWAGFRLYPDVKTLRLAKRRFYEQWTMGWELSPNKFLTLLSQPYRYLEIVKRPLGMSPTMKYFFRGLRGLLYWVILGTSQR